MLAMSLLDIARQLHDSAQRSRAIAAGGYSMLENDFGENERPAETIANLYRTA